MPILAALYDVAPLPHLIRMVQGSSFSKLNPACVDQVKLVSVDDIEAIQLADCADEFWTYIDAYRGQADYNSFGTFMEQSTGFVDTLFASSSSRELSRDRATW